MLYDRKLLMHFAIVFNCIWAIAAIPTPDEKKTPLVNVIPAFANLKNVKTLASVETQNKANLPLFDMRYDTFADECALRRIPINCAEATACTQRSGYYYIIPRTSGRPIFVECDVFTADGDWTTIQTRLDGSQNFYRNWSDYKAGFGKVPGEYFIGLDNLYALTNLDGPQELLILFERNDNVTAYAKYDGFSIGNETTNYRLESIGNYSGTAGDSLRYHVGWAFSTQDRDNDQMEFENCAQKYQSAWWFKSCLESHFNGVYGTTIADFGIYWKEFYAVNTYISKLKLKWQKLSQFFRKQPSRALCYDVGLEAAIEFCSTAQLYVGKFGEYIADPTCNQEVNTLKSTENFNELMNSRFAAVETHNFANLPVFDARYDTLPNNCSIRRFPNNCAEATACTKRSGYYYILTKLSQKAVFVECDALTDGGDWTIIQKRVDGSVDFNRTWYDYKAGFGESPGEYFIGLDNLYALTSLDGPQELYIAINGSDGRSAYAKYNAFVVANDTTNYSLTSIGSYSGTAGDSLDFHIGMQFSTPDRDNDLSTGNCAQGYGGGWWFKDCLRSNLNGPYGDTTVYRGIHWNTFYKENTYIKTVQMMIRRLRY